MLRKAVAGKEIGQLFHLRWIGAAGVQHGAAIAIYGAGVVAVERKNIAFAALGIVQVDVRQPLPAAPDAGDFDTVLRAAVNHALDD